MLLKDFDSRTQADWQRLHALIK